MYNAATPEVEGFYTGKVVDVISLGLKIRLNGFIKNYEGLVHISELRDLSNNFIAGDFIRVRIVSLAADGFISLTTRNVPQTIVNERRSNMTGNQVQSRKVRVASPGRREEKQYTGGSCSNVTVNIKQDLPPFLQNITNNILSAKIPNEIKIFRNENSPMASVAKAKQRNPAIPAFYFTEGDFSSSFVRSTTMHNDLPENFADLSMSSSPVDYKKRNKMSIQLQRESLPIFKYREEIIKAVTDNKILVLIGETGSGKTTQIPQYLNEGGLSMNGKIGCTQPRRFAATSVAHRVAEESRCMVGQQVGYKIRFDDRTGPSTVIKYMTDGILLRECMSDPNLDQYSVIILDEAHERTRDTDVLFGLLKEAVKRRANLRVIISSATLDFAKFSTFFNNAKVLRIPGKMFPVETFYYRFHTHDYFTLALNTVLNIHLREKDGDILLFLTGQDEIEQACETLENYIDQNRSRFPLNLIVLPMYSALPPDMQSDVLIPAPPGSRKVIIATNIAEASVTIDGVKFVVDPGYVKQKVNDPKTSFDSLTIVPISQASANQRTGRAGRTSPGKCYRLYTEIAYERELLPATVPDIQRSNLTATILYLKAIGVKDILNFDFMDPPKKDAIISSLKQLYFLGALDKFGDVTDLGRRITQLPVDPDLAKILIFSEKLKCTDEIITIVAMLSVGNVFYRPRKKRQLADEKKRSFDHPVSDHLRLLNVFKKWEMNYRSSDWCQSNFVNEKKLLEADEVRNNLLSTLEKFNYEIFSAGLNYERIQLTITAGFYQNIAKRKVTLLSRQNKSYINLEGVETFIHPSSSLFHHLPTWIVYNNLNETTKKFLSESTVINPEWLAVLFPNLYEVTHNPYAESDLLLEQLKQILKCID